MTTEQYPAPQSEQWPHANRLQLMADFGKFLITHGEHGGQIDPATDEPVPGDSYHLDDFEPAVHQARAQFGIAPAYIHKVYASYQPKPRSERAGNEELELTIIGIDSAKHITTQGYRVVTLDGMVGGIYSTDHTLPKQSPAERLLAAARSNTRRPLQAPDFSFLCQILQNINGDTR